MQKKILFRMRSSICLLLALLSFTVPVGTSYLGGLTAAYGFAPAIAPALEMIQMILASAGVSFQSTRDLTTFGNAYNKYWEDAANIKDFADASGMTVDEYKDFMEELNNKSFVDFGTDVAKKILTSVKDFYAHFYAQDSTGSIMDSTGIRIGGNFDGLADEMFTYLSRRGLKGYTTTSALMDYCIALQKNAKSAGKIAAVNLSSSVTTSAEYLRLNYFYASQYYSYVFAQRVKDASGNLCLKFCSVSDGSDMKAYYGSSASNYVFPATLFTSTSESNAFYIQNSYYTGTFPLDKWHFYVNVPVYDSYEDYKISTKIRLENALSKPSVSTGKTFTLPDSKTLTGDLSFTQNVENALNDADVATSEDINSAVGSLIDSYAKEIGKVQDAVDSQTGILAGWLSKIYDKLTKIEADTGTGVTVDLGDLEDAYKTDKTDPGNDNDQKKPYIWVPGSIGVVAFLKPLVEFFSEPLSDITRWLDKIALAITALPSKCAAAIGEYIPSLDDIEAGIASIQDSLSGTLTVAIDGITDLPGQIGDAVAGVIPGSIALEGVADLPKDIADAVAGAIVIPGSIALEGVADLPKDIADAIASALSGALDIPDHIALDIPETLPIAFPDTLTVDTVLDLPDVLEGAISGVFAIDDAAVSTAVDALAAEWALKFPYKQIGAVFAPLSFSDKYTYPVLKVQRPDILKRFHIPSDRLTSEDGVVYIILCDTADYAQYFKHIRNIVRAMIWVAFAYHLLRGFKVYFHIA